MHKIQSFEKESLLISLIVPVYNTPAGFLKECIDSIINAEDFTDYEIIKGGVANDKVFDTVELYFDGLISKEEALGRLVYEKPNEQICIRSQVVLDRYLHFQRSIKL